MNFKSLGFNKHITLHFLLVAIIANLGVVANLYIIHRDKRLIIFKKIIYSSLASVLSMFVCVYLLIHILGYIGVTINPLLSSIFYIILLQYIYPITNIYKVVIVMILSYFGLLLLFVYLMNVIEFTIDYSWMITLLIVIPLVANLKKT